MVARPATFTSLCAMNVAERHAGAMPSFASSPATFTWTRMRVALGGARVDLLERGLRGDRVDEGDQRQDALHLAALKPADEVPLEELSEALVLSLELVQPVLADEVDPGLGERRHPVVGHVLRRDENAHALPRLRAHLGEPLAARAPDRCP